MTEETECLTPGCMFTITTCERGFSLVVDMPDTVDLTSLTVGDLDGFHETIHDHGEMIAFQMIRRSRLREGRFDYGAGA